MAELYLMRRGSEEMFVPSEKQEQYLVDGWAVVSRHANEESAAPAVVEVPEAEEAEDVEDAAPKKPRGKK